MKTLIIYEVVPDNLLMYIVTPTQEQQALLHKVRGKFFGQSGSDDAAHEAVYDWLSTLEPVYDVVAGKMGVLILGGTTQVIHTGQLI